MFRAMILLLAVVALPAGAALNFPALTGRVVDNAHLLTAAQRSALTQKLAAAEKKTSNQVVVVTVPNLQGGTIEQFGYQLGRKWGIGQKGKDNGALLIVAPKEHKVRIEVGYGLEGVLTDALSSSIIYNDIRPAFRKGDYATGINNGVDSILKVIAGEYKAKPADHRRGGHSGASLLYLIGLVVITFLLSFGGMGGGGSGRRRGGLLFLPLGMGGFGGGGGGGFGGGGFGGGGGGFGGGGASGGW